MSNLRELGESDLAITLEGDFHLPVELIDPDGVIHTGLKGQVLYDTVVVDPETMEPMTVNNPIVSLRRSSLTRVPEAGEKWVVKIPTTPSTTAPFEDFLISPTRPPGGGASIGFIKLYLNRMEQS